MAASQPLTLPILPSFLQGRCPSRFALAAPAAAGSLGDSFSFPRVQCFAHGHTLHLSPVAEAADVPLPGLETRVPIETFRAQG